MIPAALRRREAIARGLSIRLRATARVLRGLCALAEADGHLDDRVECVARYCEALEGWCLGEREPADLRGARVALLARRSTEPEPPSARVPLLLLRCALILGERTSWWARLPTHAPDDVHAVDLYLLRDLVDVLLALRVSVDPDGARADAAQRYRTQVDDLVGLARSRFAALDAMEGR